MTSSYSSGLIPTRSISSAITGRNSIFATKSCVVPATSRAARACRSASAYRAAIIARAVRARSRCHWAIGQPSRSTSAPSSTISVSSASIAPISSVASIRHT